MLVTVAVLLGLPDVPELPEPENDDVDRGLSTGVNVISLVGLSLLVRVRELPDAGVLLLLFKTSITRSCSSLSSAFFRLCAIRPACRLC